ncbi:unnamed protein product [Moneuplotes crassus]|uniref:Uncharacterized protein n=1 Tax=Euplotes crassus TaxID=5936 RepID=A0AAD1UMR5_EUPCR|nr:unnamed protein product [Moneuplotes crassus]
MGRFKCPLVPPSEEISVYHNDPAVSYSKSTTKGITGIKLTTPYKSFLKSLPIAKKHSMSTSESNYQCNVVGSLKRLPKKLSPSYSQLEHQYQTWDFRKSGSIKPSIPKKNDQMLPKSVLQNRSKSIIHRRNETVDGMIKIYDCINNTSKKYRVPKFNQDVVDRTPLFRSKKACFHKRKYGFSNFIDISKQERELSRSKSPQPPEELPKLCSRNHNSTELKRHDQPSDYIDEQAHAAFQPNNQDAKTFVVHNGITGRITELSDKSVKINTHSKSTEKLNKSKINHCLTSSSFKIKNKNKDPLLLPETLPDRVPEDYKTSLADLRITTSKSQASTLSEYTDNERIVSTTKLGTYNPLSIQQKIKTKMKNKLLANGLSSLQAKGLKLGKVFNKNNSPIKHLNLGSLHKTPGNKKGIINLYTSIARGKSQSACKTYIGENEGIGYVKKELKIFEKKNRNLNPEPNSFTKPVKYFKQSF